jgi:hypothetical protein
MTDSSREPLAHQDTASLQANETGGSHLAHWPPPARGGELKPLAIKHRTSQPINHATRRMTRSMFAELDD